MMKYIHLCEKYYICIPSHREVEEKTMRYFEEAGKILKTPILSWMSLNFEVQRLSEMNDARLAELEKASKRFHDRIVYDAVRVRRLGGLMLRVRDIPEHIYQRAFSVVFFLYQGINPEVLNRAIRDINMKRIPHLVEKAEIAQRLGVSVQDLDAMDQFTYTLYASVVMAQNYVTAKKMEEVDLRA
jgi:hypothetical protein